MCCFLAVTLSFPPEISAAIVKGEHQCLVVTGSGRRIFFLLKALVTALPTFALRRRHWLVIEDNKFAVIMQITNDPFQIRFQTTRYLTVHSLSSFDGLSARIQDPGRNTAFSWFWWVLCSLACALRIQSQKAGRSHAETEAEIDGGLFPLVKSDSVFRGHLVVTVSSWQEIATEPTVVCSLIYMYYGTLERS